MSNILEEIKQVEDQGIKFDLIASQQVSDATNTKYS